MTDRKLESFRDYLIDSGIATSDKIDLVTQINGYNEKSFNDILYVRTGYRSFEQLKS